ncbi:hypothetical protein LOK49_LG02G03144 [Camellia lanceoleosa]|uniref:Uncharacterized protein n=1 Tax=Camellia lanceoleosa TaxID=1840588 RepID=A0ACC0IMY9_9ERIC|nr:hypothetical protein LOK49_LG02G03144 [Camellia lanceoleosa]
MVLKFDNVWYIKIEELDKLAKEQAERERQAEEQRRIEAEKAASEADRAQAREEVHRKKEILQELMKKAGIRATCFVRHSRSFEAMQLLASSKGVDINSAAAASRSYTGTLESGNEVGNALLLKLDELLESYSIKKNVTRIGCCS